MLYFWLPKFPLDEARKVSSLLVLLSWFFFLDMKPGYFVMFLQPNSGQNLRLPVAYFGLDFI